eukprot:scaffold3627_cov124-Isochrysis_galbana.AAC.8
MRGASGGLDTTEIDSHARATGCQRTNGRSTISCDTAHGMLPMSISRSEVAETRLRSPATERVGAYRTKPSSSIPRRPARPAI